MATQTKEQLKALRAKKLLDKEAGAKATSTAVSKQQAPASVQKTVPASGTPAASASKPGLPSDFFDTTPSSTASASSAHIPTASTSQPAGSLPSGDTPAPASSSGVQRPTPATRTPPSAPAAPAAAVAAVGPSAAVPAGFFDNKQADDKARGIKQPDKQDKEAAFREFQTQVDDQLRQVAADEEVEAVDAALDREEREAFEQQSRLQHIQELKAWKSGDGKARPAVDIDDAIAAAMPKAKRQRVIDALQEVLGEGGGESSEGADEGDDELLDWRAKAV
eukprot:jgi/Chrzof1/12673/Cz07g03090.t1